MSCGLLAHILKTWFFGFFKICLVNDRKGPALWVALHCEWKSEDEDKGPLSVSWLLLNDGYVFAFTYAWNPPILRGLH